MGVVAANTNLYYCVMVCGDGRESEFRELAGGSHHSCWRPSRCMASVGCQRDGLLKIPKLMPSSHHFITDSRGSLLEN